VQEHGVTYNQTVEYDPLTGDVITHVPQHQRDGILFRETTKIENLFLGVSVWREADDEFCYFRHLMKYESPLELTRVVDTAEARNVIIDSMDMIQVVVWASVDSPMTDDERDDLSDDMKLLCYDVPIMKMNTERVTLDELEEKIRDAGDCYTGHTKLTSGRGKRALSTAFQATCSTCKRHGGRQVSKRSIQNTNTFGFEDLVHLIIGHERLDCE